MRPLLAHSLPLDHDTAPFRQQLGGQRTTASALSTRDCKPDFILLRADAAWNPCGAVISSRHKVPSGPRVDASSAA